MYIILHFIIVFHLISISSIYYDPYLVSVFGGNYIHYLSPIRLSIIVINFLSLYTLLLSLKIVSIFIYLFKSYLYKNLLIFNEFRSEKN